MPTVARVVLGATKITEQVSALLNSGYVELE